MLKTDLGIWQDFFQLFFPQHCAGCGSNLPGKNSILCLHCLAGLPYTHYDSYPGNPVEKAFWGRMPVSAATSLFFFSNGNTAQRIIHEIKYKGHRTAAEWAGRLIGRSLLASGRFVKVDGLVPVPLFKSRQLMRGYNQAVLICEGIAEQTGWKLMNNALTRPAATRTQTQRNRIDRWKNMEGRFALAQPGELVNKHLLLVDDVMTTGATLEACGRALLAVPGVTLSIATLAYTV